MEPSFISTWVLPLGLAAIMFALGTTLTLADFRRVAVAPRGVAVGMVNLVVVAPLLAFGVAELFGLEPVLAIGLVLLGAAPGGTMANLLTHLARGDTALSVSMTAISSLAAAVTVPLYLGLASDHFGASGLDADLAMPLVALRVVLTTVLPLVLGMVFAARRPELVAENRQAIKWLSVAVFALIVVGAIVSQSAAVIDNLGILLAAAITLNVAAMGISFAAARVVRLGDRQATAISIELGVHNAALAVAIGASIDEQLAVPAAVYSSFMLFTAGAFARVMWVRNGAADARDAPAARPV